MQQMSNKEFRINRYLFLRLEHGRTNIYVGGLLFNQCKHLVLNLPKTDFKKYKEIQSIDEAIELYNKDYETDNVTNRSC